MKIFSRIILTSLVLLLFFSSSIHAQEIRENKSFKLTVEEPSIVESFFGGRNKTVVKNYSNQSDVPASINYKEYYENCWWSGELRNTEVRYNSQLNWYSATFVGTLKKTDCFRQLAIDENENVFGEILEIKKTPPNLTNSEDTIIIQGYSPKYREIKIRLTTSSAPSTYYYEEYDAGRGCYYGGNLVLQKTYQENGRTIAVYTGYINSAC